MGGFGDIGAVARVEIHPKGRKRYLSSAGSASNLARSRSYFCIFS